MDLKTARELKKLETRVTEHQVALDDYKVRKSELDKNINKTNQALGQLKAQIENLKASNKDTTVCEHATLRYIERVLGIDLNEINLKILPDKQREIIKN